MPHTYSSLWLHLVFGTKDRRPLIAEAWRQRLHAYLGGVVRGMEGVALEINGIADHVHLLIRIRPTHRIDYFLRDLKADSSGWIHKHGLSALFSWQRGYAAFTVSESQIGNVRSYIANQEEHHRTKTFEDEFKALLRAHNIEFDEKYLWE
jgi:putative transposase